MFLVRDLIISKYFVLEIYRFYRNKLIELVDRIWIRIKLISMIFSKAFVLRRAKTFKNIFLVSKYFIFTKEIEKSISSNKIVIIVVDVRVFATTKFLSFTFLFPLICRSLLKFYTCDKIFVGRCLL